MKRNFGILFIAIASLLTVAVHAQDTEKKRNKKIVDEKAVNTRKTTPVKIIERLPGTWQIKEVYRGKKEVTGAETEITDMITFDSEGRYVRHTENDTVDRGSYRVSEQHGRLFLESDNEGPVNEWKVSFARNGTMFLRKADDTQHAESYLYVYTRRDRGERQPD